MIAKLMKTIRKSLKDFPEEPSRFAIFQSRKQWETILSELETMNKEIKQLRMVYEKKQKE